MDPVISMKDYCAGLLFECPVAIGLAHCDIIATAAGLCIVLSLAASCLSLSGFVCLSIAVVRCMAAAVSPTGTAWLCLAGVVPLKK